MSDQTWDELALLTAKLKRLTGAKTLAKSLGNEGLSSHCEVQIKDLLRRRKHLVEQLSEYHSAPKARSHAAAIRA